MESHQVSSMFPNRKEHSPAKKCLRSSLETKLNFLLKIVDRIKGLENVSVKNVHYITRTGLIMHVPGPFAIAFPHSNGSVSQTSHGTVIDNDDDDEEAVDDVPDEDDDEETKNNPQVDEDDEDESLFRPSGAALNREKFVVRNEFGHIRLQHLLEGIEQSTYGQTPTEGSPRQTQQFDIGGHCVLPEALFDQCIRKGWGQKHMLSGRFHPIAGTVIPETTLLFYAPRNEEELEIVWTILKTSYEWALSDFPKKL